MAKDADGLTPKRRAFVDAYLGEAKGNASEAYRLAGYTVKNADVAKAEGWQLLTIPCVARAVAAGQSEAAKDVKITKELVISKLLSETEVTGERGQAGARVRASELLGKVLGLFTDRLEVRGSTDAERIAMLEGALAAEMGLEPGEAGELLAIAAGKGAVRGTDGA